MTALSWDDRTYEGGIDRGVLYLPGGGAVPWNGLKAVTPDSGDDSSEALYVDGIKFMDLPTHGDLRASLEAFTFPEEFSEIEGWTEIVDGFRATDQAPKQFDLSFRTLVGNEIDGYEFGYRVHLMYNLKAIFAPRKYETVGSDTTLTDFSWDIHGVPEQIIGFRPTAHVYLDSRYVATPAKLTNIENQLYGTSASVPMIPSLQQLANILSA